MRALFVIAGIFSLHALNAYAAAAPAESCAEIRAQIAAHVGVPSRPNTDLLGKVGAHRECRFTSAEAYRAAWGDKPMPQDAPRERRSGHREEDDED